MKNFIHFFFFFLKGKFLHIAVHCLTVKMYLNSRNFVTWHYFFSPMWHWQFDIDSESEGCRFALERLFPLSLSQPTRGLLTLTVSHDYSWDEKPAKSVTLKNPFLIWFHLVLLHYTIKRDCNYMVSS